MSKTIYSEKFSQQEQERITQEFREALQRKGSTVSPILPFTDAIASTRLGKKWCENFDFFPEYKGQTDLGKRCLRRAISRFWGTQSQPLSAMPSPAL